MILTEGSSILAGWGVTQKMQAMMSSRMVTESLAAMHKKGARGHRPWEELFIQGKVLPGSRSAPTPIPAHLPQLKHTLGNDRS